MKELLLKIWNDGIIVTNSFIPRYTSWFISVYAITLWPFVFIKDEGNDQTIRHEKIHLRQQRELLLVGFLGFYILYVCFWLFHLVRLRQSSEAYHAIPFEKEAYAHEEDEDYLDQRPLLAWRNYMA